MKILVADQHGGDDLYLRADTPELEHWAFLKLFKSYKDHGYYDEYEDYVPPDLPVGYELTKKDDVDMQREVYLYQGACANSWKAAKTLLQLRTGYEDESWYFDELVEP